MNEQLLYHLLTEESLYPDFISKLTEIHLEPYHQPLLNWVETFKEEKGRLPSWEELRLKFKDLPERDGLPIESVKDAWQSFYREEKVKSWLIGVADKLDKHKIDSTIFDEAEKLKEEMSFKVTSQLELPLSLSEFLKQDILPLQYWVKDILQKEGRTMLSSSMNVGKSFFLQQLALTVSSGQPTFLDKFSITQGRILYLDCEMGTSALKDRFSKMAYNLDTSNLFIQYSPALDLLNSEDRQNLEHWLADLKIDILIIDPIGNAWHGDENKAQDVSLVTSYLDGLREKYKVAILLSHHWKKKSKDLRRGFEMASGSYRWSAWIDCHITLEGNIDNVTVTCEKARNSARFSPFMIKLNEETLTFEFLADYTKKYTEETLVNLFNQADIDKIGRVAIADLVKLASGKPSKATLQRLIDKSTLFIKESAGQRKRAYLRRKDIKSPDLFDSLAQKDAEPDSEIENE